MNINCIDYKITNANGVLQPIILQAIKDIYLKGDHQMTARMVRNQCISTDNNIPWGGRLPAICNAMRNSIGCGGRIIGEDRDYLDFTIAFDSNGNNLEIKTPKKTNPKVESKNKEGAYNTKEIVKKSKKTKPSINKIEEFSKIIEKYNLNKLKTDIRPKLLIIPCSKSKSPGGINVFNSIFNLNPNRTNSINLYDNERTINPNYYNNEIRVGVNVVDVNYFNAAFNNTICKRAIDRYDGSRSIFYRNYGLKNLYLQKINNNKLHVLIVSGLYGLLRFDDLIPDYHLEMNKNPIWTNPYDFSIRDAVKEYILVNNIPNENVFYSLADNEYRQALKPDLNWKLIWIQNGGIGSSYTTAKFIAQEFLPRL
jgi:cytoplasmic iron level regulating protein YaaA (DUF328/UPF0246 family)